MASANPSTRAAASPRPQPIGKNVRGVDLYSGQEVAAYRLVNGVTQQQVAAHLRVGQSLVAAYETGRYPELQARQAVRLLQAIDFLVACRNRLVSEGEARIAAMAS